MVARRMGYLLLRAFALAAPLALLLGPFSGCRVETPPENGSPAAGTAGMLGAGSGAGAPANTSGSTAPAPRAGTGGAATSAGAGGAPMTAGAAGAAGAAGGGSGGAGGSAAPACSGKPGALRGKSDQSVMAAGLMRTFIHYAPAGLDPNTPAPIVIVAHGYTMNAQMMFEITKYSELADREKFIVMFPDGQPDAVGPWNVGDPTCLSTLGVLPLAEGDDQAFIDAMIGMAEADQCIDHGHIFVTGFSMGGYFSNATGCARPEIRAIAPHSGGVHELTGCASQHKPALIMHFNGDALIPTECGTEARDRWVMHNGCDPGAPDVRMVQGGRCEYYKNCPKDGQVAFCAFDIPTTGNRDELFAGHAWSGGSDEGPAGGAPFAIPETASASELGWGFFKEFAW